MMKVIEIEGIGKKYAGILGRAGYAEVNDLSKLTWEQINELAKKTRYFEMLELQSTFNFDVKRFIKLLLPLIHNNFNSFEGKIMERSAPKWFGFTLTQKQSVSIFVFALIGMLICVLVFVTAFTSIFMNYYIYYGDPYYIMDDSYFTIMIISQLPLLVFFFVIFVICCYTLSRCRKTAKYYNQNSIHPQIGRQTQVPRTPQIRAPQIKPIYDEMLFCPNCGSKHGESHQYCTNCGNSLI